MKFLKSDLFKRILAVSLSVCVFLCIFLCTGYYTNWFGMGNSTENTQGDELNVDSVVFNSGKINGISLTTTQVTPNDSGTGSCTVTATIEPSNLSDKTVTMSVAWADASSDWADGKTVTDYVTVTQDSTGSLTGTLECLQAFGEQVVLTVTSNLDSTYYAQSTIDYVKRVDSVSIKITDESGSTNTSFYIESEGIFNCTIVYGTGTLTGEVDFDYFYGIDTDPSYMSAAINYIKAQDEYVSFYTLQDYIENNYGSDWNPYSHWYLTSEETITSDSSSCSIVCPFYISSLKDYIINVDKKTYYDSETVLALMEKIYPTIATAFGIHYTYSYNGVNYASGFEYTDSYIYPGVNSVSSVSVEETSYIF